MATHTLRAVALSAIFSFAACTHLVPLHGQSIEEQAADDLYCTEVAQGITPDVQPTEFVAAGNPQFVRNTAIAYGAANTLVGLAHAVAVAHNYNTCMTMRGYRREQNN